MTQPFRRILSPRLMPQTHQAQSPSKTLSLLPQSPLMKFVPNFAAKIPPGIRHSSIPSLHPENCVRCPSHPCPGNSAHPNSYSPSPRRSQARKLERNNRRCRAGPARNGKCSIAWTCRRRHHAGRADLAARDRAETIAHRDVGPIQLRERHDRRRAGRRAPQ